MKRKDLLDFFLVSVLIITQFGIVSTFCRKERVLLMLDERYPIRKVGIIGGGIAGLSTAASLKILSEKYRSSPLEEISVFESRDNILQSNLGGGLQLSGGAKILEELGLSSALHSIAKPLKGVICKNSRKEILFELNIEDALSKQRADELQSPVTKRPYFCTVMRDALISLLFNATQQQQQQPARSSSADQIFQSPKVKIYPKHRLKKFLQEGSSGSTVQVEFENGARYADFDLVILADGVNSIAVRSQLEFKNIFGSPLNEEVSDTGIRITYCILPIPSAEKKADVSFQQFMGDGLYVLIGEYGGLQQSAYTMLAIIYKEEPTEGRTENAEWNLSPLQKQTIRSRLKLGYLHTSPEINSIIDRLFETSSSKRSNRDEYRIFDLGVKNRMVPLKRWSSASGRVVLVGDCAHAMAPFFGQGANQALQDAYCISNLIHTYNQGIINRDETTGNHLHPLTVKDIAEQYESKRKFHTTKLVLKSYFLGQLETLGGSLGMIAKDLIFQTLFRLGIVEKEFIEAATPML